MNPGINLNNNLRKSEQLSDVTNKNGNQLLTNCNEHTNYGLFYI